MGGRRRGASRLVGALCAWMCLAPAHADPLARARAAQLRVDYEGALGALDAALAAGELARVDLLAAVLLRGELLSALGRAAAATDSYVEALAIDAGATLPDGISPRARAAFAAAIARTPAPVRVRCSIDAARGVLAVELDRGASTRATQVRVERRDAGRAEPVRDQVTPPAALVLPARASTIGCAAIDAEGSVLAEQPPLAWTPGRSATPERAPVDTAGPPADPVATRFASDPPVAADEAPRPSWRDPWIWGGATVVAGAGAITFGVLAARDQRALDDLTAQSSEHEFSEADAVRARGARRATWANVLWIGTGALALGTLACALWPGSEPSAAPTSTVRLELGPGVVGVAGSF